MRALLLTLAFCTFYTRALPRTPSATLKIGTGIWDATGVINDVNMMGMANPKQVGAGLHQRLRSRAFVAHNTATGKRFAFVSLDAGMGSEVLNNRVISELQKRFPGLYTAQNVGISGTHTHSGPSGFLQHTIFQFAGSGWVPEVLDAMVNGVVESISMAHHRLTPAKASTASGILDDSNINRSPTAYILNPAEERAQYGHDTDHEMTVLKMLGDDGTELGAFSFFAVHGTSMNNTNLLVSGDNKGYASYKFEKLKNGNASVGHGRFVAGFPATNLGDVSPNTAGAKCRDTGLPCDAVHSTCDGRSQMCSSSGPGRDMFESTEIIGQKQVDKAVELYALEGLALDEEVDYAQAYVRMPGLNVSDDQGKPLGKLCTAAVGDSFAAGTTDGPGQFDFTQSANSSNPLWHFAVSFVHKSSPEERACQAPKGILLPTGSINFPYPWAPSTVSIQILRLGQLILLVVPTELTTMAGRRLRNAVRKEMIADGAIGEDAVLVVAGLANGYADYTTTYEEYHAQRYEGASTIFGPHQLAGYVQEFRKLAKAIATGTKPVSAPPYEDFSSRIISEGKGFETDHLPSGAKAFGDVLRDASPSYPVGEEVVVTFAGASALNNMRLQGSFIRVERCSDDKCSEVVVVAEDGDWETRIEIQKSTVGLAGHARTWTVSWFVPSSTHPGFYRIVYDGTRYNKPAVGKPGACPVCTCESPTIWPVSGCDVKCGAKCGDTCCCIPGVGNCGGFTEFQGASRTFKLH